MHSDSPLPPNSSSRRTRGEARATPSSLRITLGLPPKMLDSSVPNTSAADARLSILRRCRRLRQARQRIRLASWRVRAPSTPSTGSVSRDRARLYHRTGKRPRRDHLPTGASAALDARHALRLLLADLREPGGADRPAGRDLLHRPGRPGHRRIRLSGTVGGVPLPSVRDHGSVQVHLSGQHRRVASGGTVHDSPRAQRHVHSGRDPGDHAPCPGGGVSGQ